MYACVVCDCVCQLALNLSDLKSHLDVVVTESSISLSYSSKVFPFIRMGCVSSKFLKKHLYVNDDYDGGG